MKNRSGVLWEPGNSGLWNRVKIQKCFLRLTLDQELINLAIELPNLRCVVCTGSFTPRPSP